MDDPIKTNAITVRTGRMVFEVEIENPAYRNTTPKLAAFVSGQFPDLPHHACVNDKGHTFGDVIESTSVPHLLEHLIISNQVRNHVMGDLLFMGTTEWVNEEAGIACIEIGFKDDLAALRAFNEATLFLNMAVLTCLP